MADSRVMRHLALIALVLIGIFIYAGFRIKHLAQNKPAVTATSTKGSSVMLAGDDSSSRHLATAEPAAKPTPIPAPSAVPAPALPFTPRIPDKAKAEVATPPLPVAPNLTPRAAKRNDSLGGNAPAQKIKPRIPTPRKTPPPPPLPAPTPAKDSYQPTRTATINPTPRIDIEADGAASSYYIVKTGDTLSGIARRLLGSSVKARHIFAANRDILADDDHLGVGMRLRIPGWKVGEQRAPRTAAEPAPKAAANPRIPTRTRTYKVKPGDTLYGLAIRFYGTPSSWRKIHAANRKQIPDPNRLRIGVKLVIPGGR